MVHRLSVMKANSDGTLMKANSDGTLKSHLPLSATGPDGEEIEPGDTVTFRLITTEDAQRRSMFSKKTHRANSDGSIGLVIPHWTTGPDGEEIEPGDVVTFEVVEVQKKDGT